MDMCPESCAAEDCSREELHGHQTSQAATVGYQTDYASKRKPIPVQEIRLWTQGHRALRIRNVRAPIGYLTRRHAKRILSDAYCRGVVRGAVEASNLSAHFSEHDPLAAETVRTADSTNFPGAALLARLEFLADAAAVSAAAAAVRAHATVDPRDPRRRKVQIRDVEFLYGHRGGHPFLWYLGPFEFVRHWEGLLASYPRSLKEEKDTEKEFHAKLTPAGRAKLQAARIEKLPPPTLFPGADYVVQTPAELLGSETNPGSHSRHARCAQPQN
jgi:Methionine synthase I, cobalamin-binding domain